MCDFYVIEDGIIIKELKHHVLWSGMFSEVKKDGQIIHFLINNLPKNSVCVIPRSDGNINRTRLDNEYSDVSISDIQYYIDYAKDKNKVFILATLCQIREESDINYLYLPLDDNIFEKGIKNVITDNLLINWNNKDSLLCWRGGCSGINGGNSLRVKFVKKIQEYESINNVKLSKWWSENKNIPDELFSERLNYIEFLKYKIFFIVDGACISSNYMWGFATGCIPFLISNAKCWFNEFIQPYVHYIPIEYDLSNLYTQINWVRNNDKLAEIIANNARKFAELYFSSEFQQNYIKENINKIYISYFKDKHIDYRPKIIDAFIFYNELELLYYRLSILYNYVDYFVIVEANQTFNGNNKINYYETNKYLFKKFEKKIIHIIVSLPLTKENCNFNLDNTTLCFINENYHRNCIDKGINKLGLNDDDLIIISDLDEIIDPLFINKIMEERIYNIITINKLIYDFYYYNLNTQLEEKWTKVKIMKYKFYKLFLPENIRQQNNNKSLTDKSVGWHFSYFGDPRFIQTKLDNFSHQELNTKDINNSNNIQESINNNIDLFHRSYVKIYHIPTNINKFLPPMYNIYLKNYIKEKTIQNSKPIYIYFHICCINNWEDIVNNLLFKIKHSGLYYLVSEIRCFILGEEKNINDEIFKEDKIKIIFFSNDLTLREKNTINILIEDSKLTDAYILYIHSKGLTHYNTNKEIFVYDWTEYLAYFNIYNFQTCIHLLQYYDCISVNLQNIDSNNNPVNLHYSGNFWWSKTSHISNLNIIEDNYYNSPEFKITSIPGTYVSLWNTIIDHYYNSYSFIEYENKEIKYKIIENR
jgi:beta-1,4-mannosyl-glycoprotein beta-1,4-N-acetylglucosaminyltransferase